MSKRLDLLCPDGERHVNASESLYGLHTVWPMRVHPRFQPLGHVSKPLSKHIENAPLETNSIIRKVGVHDPIPSDPFNIDGPTHISQAYTSTALNHRGPRNTNFVSWVVSQNHRQNYPKRVVENNF